MGDAPTPRVPTIGNGDSTPTLSNNKKTPKMAKSLKQRIVDSKKKQSSKASGFEAIDPFKSFLSLVDDKKCSAIKHSKDKKYPYVVIDHICLWISQQSLKDWTKEDIKKHINTLKVGYSKGSWTLFKFPDDEEGIDLSWD